MSEQFRISMCCCEETILGEIGMKELHQKDIAMTYALAMRSRETIDWGKVNRAIMERWSKSGLIRIKTMAHSGSCFSDPAAAGKAEAPGPRRRGEGKMSGPNYEQRDDGLYVCHGDHHRSEPCTFVKVEPMPDLPDCPGCTEPNSEGTHVMGTKQHPNAEPAKYIPWTEAGGPNECEHGYAAGIPCPHCDSAKESQPHAPDDCPYPDTAHLCKPPAPAMRVDDARAELMGMYPGGHSAQDIRDLLHDRAAMVKELERLRAENAAMAAELAKGKDTGERQ